MQRWGLLGALTLGRSLNGGAAFTQAWLPALAAGARAFSAQPFSADLESASAVSWGAACAGCGGGVAAQALPGRIVCPLAPTLSQPAPGHALGIAVIAGCTAHLPRHRPSCGAQRGAAAAH